MNKKNKDLLNLGLGIAAGVVIGYYLSSEEGKKLRLQAQKQIEEISEELGVRAQEQIDTMMGGFDSALTSGKQYAQEVSSTVESKLSKKSEEAEDLLSSAKNSFLRGMERARQRFNK